VLSTPKNPPVRVRGRSAFAMAMLVSWLLDDKPLDAMVGARTLL
jgi:hypothetical protein